MTNPNEQEKYVFSQERERELLVKAFRLYEKTQFKNLTDIFNIDLDDLHRVEKFYVQTCMLLYKKHNYIEKIPTDSPIYPDGSFKGGYVDLNIRYSNSIIENVTKISLNSIFPVMMMNMTKKEITNHKGFTEMLKDLYIEYKNISTRNKDIGLGIKSKEYMNLVYGMLLNQDVNSYLKPNIEMHNIPERTRQLIVRFKNEFSGNYIYADTDTIYLNRFNEISTRLKKYIKELTDKYDPLEISMYTYSKGIFIQKKKIILFDENGQEIIKGFKTIS